MRRRRRATFDEIRELHSAQQAALADASDPTRPPVADHDPTDHVRADHVSADQLQADHVPSRHLATPLAVPGVVAGGLRRRLRARAASTADLAPAADPDTPDHAESPGPTPDHAGPRSRSRRHRRSAWEGPALPEWFDEGSTSPAPAVDPVDDDAERPDVAASTMRSDVVAVLLVFVAALSAMFAAYHGLPVLGRDLRLVPLLAGLLVVTTNGWLAFRFTVRWRRAVPAVAAVAVLLTASFVVGLYSSVSVDGRIFPAWSSTAKVHRFADEVTDARNRFADADALLALSPEEARARFSELEPAKDEMLALNRRWATMPLADLPAGEFAPVQSLMATASFSAAEALQDKIDLLSTPDARVDAELKLQREQFVSAVLKLDDTMASLSSVWEFRWGLDPGMLE